ncbi:MAG TPA: FecR domain-containing protein [Prolixibacteraceae bacterium]|nr:FecR domain-containing protein [Prolixibacteraceae bacterium]
MTVFEQKFIEDPQFLKWVFNSNPTINQFWESYIIEHPEEKKLIVELKNQLLELKISNNSIQHSEKEKLAKRILNQIDFNQKSKKRNLILASFLKYAAVAIIFAFIGGLLVYMSIGNVSVYEQFARQTIQIPSSNQGPLLITSNGENVDLRKSSSSVDYSQEGSVVLNNDSVIHTKTDLPDIMNQLVIPYGNQSKVVLSDHTVVWLNAGSRLVYPTLFKGKTREVILFGEAFFEVSKNPENPFIVKTSDLSIKVLGTQFNVSAYAEDNVIQTVLKEGSVSITKRNSGIFERELVLKPNQMASFNKYTSDTRVYNVDATYYTFWTQGLLSFDDTDFNRIVRKVERFYNIKISFSEPRLGSIRISGKLDLKQNKEEVLEYLKKVSLTRIESVGDNQYIVKK